MKVAILSESPADEAALRIVVDAAIGVATTSPSMPPLRSRGWPSVGSVISSVIRHLHYQTDAEALVVVVDSNGSAPHALARHEQQRAACRFCALQMIIDDSRGKLRPVPARRPLLVALGVAIPAIESWYAGADDPRLSEQAATERIGRQGTADTLKRDLKRRVYGGDRPTLGLERERAIAAAARIASHLDELASRFPEASGRSWRS